MQSRIMSIFTRTPLHVGAGSSVGAVDMPIIRERHTRFPVIPGSSIKGVLADFWLEKGEDGKIVRSEEGRKIFGSDDSNDASAGAVAFGEAKLLAFPVRSAKGCFAFITCPLALRRFARDKGIEMNVPEIAETDRAIINGGVLAVKGSVVFEEYPLSVKDPKIDDAIISALKSISNDKIWEENVGSRLAIVSDELFSYFAENACEIANHNCVDDETGVVKDGALFSQENVPSETMFYAMLNEEKDGSISQIEARLKSGNNLLQIGGKETTGLGWCSVEIKEAR